MLFPCCSVLHKNYVKRNRHLLNKRKYVRIWWLRSVKIGSHNMDRMLVFSEIEASFLGKNSYDFYFPWLLILTAFSDNRLISWNKTDRINRLNLIYFQLSDHNYKRKYMRLQHTEKFRHLIVQRKLLWKIISNFLISR